MKRAFAAVLLVSCNALTGVGKYDLDCPSSDPSCDGGATDAQGDASGGSDGAAGDATADAPPLTCTGGRAPLTVIVGAIADSVADTSGNNVTVAPSNSQSYCATPNSQYRLETSGGISVTWRGVSCKDGPTGNRCEFNLTAPTGATVTVSP